MCPLLFVFGTPNSTILCVLHYFLTHRVKNMCVLLTPRGKIVFIISECLCVNYAQLCVFRSTETDVLASSRCRHIDMYLFFRLFNYCLGMRKIDSLRAFDYPPWDEENVNLDEVN